MNVRRFSRIAALVSFLVFCGQPLLAQGVFATLTGVVSDSTGAVVPNAKVVLTDAGSGSARDTQSDSDGFFTFASVPVGTYNLSVTAAGFKDYAAANITLGGGEKRNVNVALNVGTAAETVSVDAGNTALAVTDSGERSFALSTKELQNFIQVGSNAAEYIKIMPGFGIRTAPEPRKLHRPNHRHQRQWRCRQPEPAQQCLLLQRVAGQLARYHGGRRARLRSRLQLRYACQSQL